MLELKRPLCLRQRWIPVPTFQGLQSASGLISSMEPLGFRPHQLRPLDLEQSTTAVVRPPTTEVLRLTRPLLTDTLHTPPRRQPLRVTSQATHRVPHGRKASHHTFHQPTRSSKVRSSHLLLKATLDRPKVVVHHHLRILPSKCHPSLLGHRHQVIGHLHHTSKVSVLLDLHRQQVHMHPRTET